MAALRRFLAAFPHTPGRARCPSTGTAYLARGKSRGTRGVQPFLKEEGFQAETDEARRDRAELAMDAPFQVGQILQGQQKFDEAIAAWKGYLAKFPNGPQSADAQRAILDTAAHDRRRPPAAAAVSPRPAPPGATSSRRTRSTAACPQLLFEVGESFEIEKKFDQAIAAWETLDRQVPRHEPAAHAQFAIASIYENEKGDPAAAIERFRRSRSSPGSRRPASGSR